MNRYVCIHGHFYQPPRMNPWLEVVETQDSAAPFHDWNARINAECYAPNAAARILGDKGLIHNIVNNYERISFNFGPTLLSWLERFAPGVHQGLIQADQNSAQRLGHGNAMAQVYSHLIMPLATRRDKLTQIRWGVSDFERRFGRSPEGMWLAETAVDAETLECLAEEGILFTVLAPSQAEAVRPDPEHEWAAVDGTLEVRRPYQVPLPGGGSIAVFFYDGGISQSIAFEGLLKDGYRLAQRLLSGLEHEPPEPQLVSVATDGESYGHHHRFGEMALAFALDLIDKDPGTTLTNYAAFLAEHPPTWQAKVRDNSSWSCAHGVERWRSDCGCAVDPGKGWNQKWRAPLRQVLDALKAHLDGLFEDQGGKLFKDCWAALDDYAATLPYSTGQKAWQDLLADHQAHELSPEERVRAAILMECQRWGHLMFTSCGWFFDDIAGLEPVQNLRFAARALQLAEELGAEGWRQELVQTLSQAISNQAKEGTGADIWQRRVAPAQVGVNRVAAHAAISTVISGRELPAQLHCFELEPVRHSQRHSLGMHLGWGRARVRHQRVTQDHELVFAALYTGGHDFFAHVAHANEEHDLTSLAQEVETPLRAMDKPLLISVLEKRVGGRCFTLGDLFLEERRSLAREVLAETVTRHGETARQIFQDNIEALTYFASISVPLPRLFIALAEAVITEDLLAALEKEPGSLPEGAGELAAKAKTLGVKLTSRTLVRAITTAVGAGVRALEDHPGDEAPAAYALAVLDLAEALEQEPDLWEPQNLFNQLIGRHGWEALSAKGLDLGQRLNFNPPDSN